jgi:hypothetical protein
MGQAEPFHWTLDSAFAFWSEWAEKLVEDDGVGPRFWSAELFILTYQPATIAEALCQLEVARDNFIGGGRGDGLDIQVMDKAMDLMRHEVLLQAVALAGRSAASATQA